MARSPVSSEGIRFLDDSPPTTPPAAAPAKSAKASKKRGFPIGLLTFLAVVGIGLNMKLGGPGSGDVKTNDQIQRSFEVEPGTRVEVETFNGAVQVQASDSDQVECTIDREASAVDEATAKAALTGLIPEIVQDGNRIIVRVQKAEWYRPGWKGKASVTVAVPRDAQVQIATAHGSIDVDGVVGAITGKTRNGEVRVRNAEGLIELESSNGSIDCNAFQALARLKTSNGEIHFQGSLTGGASEFTSQNGDINLRLPEDQDFRLEATTRNGEVESEFRISGESKRNRLIGDRGDNPETIVLATTHNGDIEIDRED